MELGFCADCVAGDGLERKMEDLKRAGFDFVEPAWRADDHAKLGAGFGEELKALGARTGCPVRSAIHGSFSDLGKRIRDAAGRALEMDIFARYLDTLAAAGGNVLLLPNWAGENGEDFDALYVSFLREGAERAAKLGLTLGLEHIPRSKYRNTAVLVYELVEKVNAPNLGVYYDIANGLYAGEDNLASARCVAPRVVQFHVKDYNKHEIPLEKMPLREAKAIFEKAGFKGRVAVEIGPSDDPKTNRHLDAAIKTLRAVGY
ncbi:MAG: sugar phosphate isomerase/epimerase [Planctomycetota bacterium]|nr:sugar phosphate isomerase/epimerase [Planctomycetota bacterium]